MPGLRTNHDKLRGLRQNLRGLGLAPSQGGGTPANDNFIDDNGITSFVDDNGVTSFTDDLGN